MSVGKYSPTVSDCYSKDQDWFRKNTTGEDSWYDDDGFDSYGYDRDDKDRAGIYENDYIVGEWINEGTESEEYVHELYSRVYREWTCGIVNGRLVPVRQ